MEHILIPTLIVGGLGAILGLVLAVGSKVFHIETDPRLETLINLLPGYNCGGCGYAGCAGMANGLLSKETDKVSQCKPSNPAQRQKIVDYLTTTPGPDGSTLNVHL